MSHYSGEVKFVDAGVKVWDGLDAKYTEKSDHFEVTTVFNPSVTVHKDVKYVSFRKATGFFSKNDDGTKGGQYSYTSTVSLATIKDDGSLTPLVDLKGNHPIEDVRLFSRPDGLYGVGTVWGFNGVDDGIKVGICRIDPEKKSYEVLEQYPSPFGSGRTEKNWSPTEDFEREFDYTYSPTAIMRGGRFFQRTDHNDDKIRGGSQLLRLGNDGWVSVRHILQSVKVSSGDRINKFYSTVVCLHDFSGYITHISDPFHMGSGERNGWWKAGKTEKPGKNEFIEYVSGAIWHEKDKSMLITLGIVDEICGYGILDLGDLNFHEYDPDDFYYNLSVVAEDLNRAVS